MALNRELRSRPSLAAFTLVLAILGTTAARGQTSSTEPYYRGKSLTLWSHALAEQNPEIRVRALNAIGQMDLRARSQIDAVAKLLSDPDARVRRAAAVTLAGFGPLARRAAPALTSALGDSDSEVRQDASMALGEIGPEAGAAAAALGRLLCKPDNDQTCSAAAASLGKLGAASAPELMEALRSQFPFVRDLAAEALDANEPAAAKSVEALLVTLTDRSSSVRADASAAIGHVGPAAAPALATLIAALHDPDLAVRIKTADALGNIGPAAATALPALHRTLNAPEVEMQIASAGAVWSIARDANAAVSVLLSAADDPDSANRAYVLRLLGAIGPKMTGVVGTLITALDDQAIDVRCVAIGSLAQIGRGAGPAAASLRGLSKDPSPEVRLLATEALWGIDHRPSDVITPMHLMLDDARDPPLRARAAAALGLVGPSALAVLPSLRAAMKDSAAVVRIAAAEAVWRVTDDTGESLPLLIACANDQSTRDVDSRVQAIRTLAAMGRAAQPALPALSLDMTDDFPVVRSAAAAAVSEIRSR